MEAILSQIMEPLEFGLVSEKRLLLAADGV